MFNENKGKYRLAYHRQWTKKFNGVTLYAYPQFMVEKGECEVWMKTKWNIILKHHGYSWQNIGIRKSYPTYYSVHNIIEEEGDIITISGSLAEFNMNGDASDGTGHYSNDKNWPKKMSMEEYEEWKNSKEEVRSNE